MKKYTRSFIINLGLLISGLLTTFSGMLIQIQYHLGNPGNESANGCVLGINYSGWSGIHKIAIIMISILIVFHISLHWKWYKTVIAKRLLNKNRQIITLTIIFVSVAVTGFVPWIIDLLESSQTVRKAFIEIHDKLAIILSIYLILHVFKRLKWFFTTFEKMTKNTALNSVYEKKVK